VDRSEKIVSPLKAQEKEASDLTNVMHVQRNSPSQYDQPEAPKSRSVEKKKKKFIGHAPPRGKRIPSRCEGTEVARLGLYPPNNRRRKRKTGGLNGGGRK